MIVLSRKKARPSRRSREFSPRMDGAEQPLEARSLTVPLLSMNLPTSGIAGTAWSYSGWTGDSDVVGPLVIEIDSLFHTQDFYLDATGFLVDESLLASSDVIGAANPNGSQVIQIAGSMQSICTATNPYENGQYVFANIGGIMGTGPNGDGAAPLSWSIIDPQFDPVTQQATPVQLSGAFSATYDTLSTDPGNANTTITFFFNSSATGVSASADPDDPNDLRVVYPSGGDVHTLTVQNFFTQGGGFSINYDVMVDRSVIENISYSSSITSTMMMGNGPPAGPVDRATGGELTYVFSEAVG